MFCPCRRAQQPAEILALHRVDRLPRSAFGAVRADVALGRSGLADFTYFLAIAKHRSFRRAGLEVGVSASALSPRSMTRHGSAQRSSARLRGLWATMGMVHTPPGRDGVPRRSRDASTGGLSSLEDQPLLCVRSPREKLAAFP